MKQLLSIVLLAPLALAAAAPPAKKPAAAAADPAIHFHLPAGDRDYLWTMIACDEGDERYIEVLYDSFLTLAQKQELPAGDFRVPARLAAHEGGTFRFERGYYLTPNVLRGFILSIPEAGVVVQDEMITLAGPLVVASWSAKQGIQIVVLKKKDAHAPPEPARPAGARP